MNDDEPQMPYRKQMRLKGYDYSQAGCYFITICTLLRREILGCVAGGDAHIAPYGRDDASITPRGCPIAEGSPVTKDAGNKGNRRTCLSGVIIRSHHSG